MQALRAAALPKRPVLFRLPGLPVVLNELYAAAADLASCRILDWALAKPTDPVPDEALGHGVLDLRDFAFDPAFQGRAMIDYFLERLGRAPESLPPSARRNTWLSPRLPPAPVGSRGHVLLCPVASMAMRTMPQAVQAALAGRLARLGRAIVTQGLDLPGTIPMPRADSLAELAGWVAASAVVVSTDTAMVHLADAYDVPCVAVFTTHHPAWRVRDYPGCRAVHRPAALPDALEFARGPADLAAAEAAWFGPHGGLDWLDEVTGLADAAIRGG